MSLGYILMNEFVVVHARCMRLSYLHLSDIFFLLLEQKFFFLFLFTFSKHWNWSVISLKKKRSSLNSGYDQVGNEFVMWIIFNKTHTVMARWQHVQIFTFYYLQKCHWRCPQYFNFPTESERCRFFCIIMSLVSFFFHFFYYIYIFNV